MCKLSSSLVISVTKPNFSIIPVNIKLSIMITFVDSKIRIIYSSGERRKIKVGISVGDLNGIGMEVVLKTFEDKRMFDFCTPVLLLKNR